MKKQFFITFILLLLSITTFKAQVFDGEWSCLYATDDDDLNGTGNRTMSLTVIGEDKFVALVSRESNNNYYIVGYSGADSSSGRFWCPIYGSADNTTIWVNGFDQVVMNKPLDLASASNYIFVPNNDAEHNILVFEMTVDSLVPHPWRMATGSSDSLWAIDIDDQGRVYVTRQGSDITPGTILIYDSPANEPAWSTTNTATPLQEITLPDNGSARGITVDGTGSLIYVTNYSTGKIYCYTGDPSSGYTLNTGFNFQLRDTLFASTGDTIVAGPWGLQLMPTHNILFAAFDEDLNTLGGYEYSRVFLLDPNNGNILDTLDVAEWNYAMTGAYNNNEGGKVSGYGSSFNVDFDSLYNVYTSSYYGWTVDKWQYSTTLPTIIIVGIEKDPKSTPLEFSLEQNYPNPFNPSTSIEFSIDKEGDVSLSVYSITGELIGHLINSTSFAAGTYRISFDASKLAAGTYIYTLRLGNQTVSKKMMLLK